MGTLDKDEKAIREALEVQLGVEFYSPDDPETNIDVTKSAPEPAKSDRDRVLDNVRNISVSELITRCAEASKLMSRTNPHRVLLWNCAFALRQLVERIDRLEGSKEH